MYSNTITAIMEKVTSILNQALFKHIYNVKKKGFQSRVAVRFYSPSLNLIHSNISL